MFLIRQAGPADFEGVYPLAKVLDSYNLPADRGYVRRLLEISARSFQGRVARSRARYLFVLEQRRPGRRIVGCSLIIAKHGTRGHPHLWLGIEKVRRYSRTLRLERFHRVLRLGFTEDGPTEVGGLVVLPRYRRHPAQCGLHLSFVRFLYMAMHPDRFEREILVEYRGAMGAGNRSPFWEKIGRVFTGLSYKKADHLSVENKEFILGLLPREPIYTALLPLPVQGLIGAIHPTAQRAARLLRSIGFKPMAQIEPFDGGPYYTARRRAIRIVRGMERFRMASVAAGGGSLWFVGTEAGGFFRAATAVGSRRGGRFALEPEAVKVLGLQPGDPICVCRLSR